MSCSQHRIAILFLSLTALTGAAGCPVVSNLPAPGRVLTQDEPESGRKYYLYVPTCYRDDRRWPLVVTCHGTPYWDTARAQLDTWKGLAEQEGFLLAAPELIGTRGGVRIEPPEQIRRQLDDEKAILATVRSIRAARSVDESRIFLTGWSAGGYAVLFTGLRNPDIFRALAVYQGNFDATYVEPCTPFLDRHQAVQVVYGDIDPIAVAQPCIDWLRNHGSEPDVVERPGIHKRDPRPMYAFFAEVVRHRPWIRIKVQDDPADEMQISFSARTSFKPTECLWDFGDKQRSQEASPTHRYEQPGLYTVRVRLQTPGGKSCVRPVQLQVPRVRLGVVAPATAPEQ